MARQKQKNTVIDLGLGDKPAHLADPPKPTGGVPAPDPESLLEGRRAVIENFIKALFPHPKTERDEDAHLIFAIKHGGQNGWRPIPMPEFLRRYMADPARGCYIGTSMTVMGPDIENPAMPGLRHGDKYFHSMRCLVLDDVRDPGKLPPAFQNPTTIVESSPNNYQCGYALDEPEYDIGVAKQAVKAIYAAGRENGLWDSGGALSIKWIRLGGFGVNSKLDANRQATDRTWFPVRLVEANPGRRFNLVALAAAVGFDMAGPVAQAQRALEHFRRSQGETTVTAEGFTDPFFQRLEDLGEIIGPNSSGYYFEVTCPWADEHTNGDPTSNFKPMGLVSDYPDSVNYRHWKCFHGHCADRKTEDFIEAMQEKYGAALFGHWPVMDPTVKMALEWVYVASATEIHGNAGGYISMATGEVWTVQQMRNTYSQIIPGTKTPYATKFHNNELRTTFRKAEFRPDKPNERIFNDRFGHPVLNTFRRPELLTEPYDSEFMKGWIKRHRELYGKHSKRILQNWAYKLRHPSHRGYLELNMAERQRTGRTSLIGTYLDQFLPSQVAVIPLKRLLQDWENHHLKLIIVINEVRTDSRSAPLIAEILKDSVDTTPDQRRELNIKGRAIAESVRIFTSWKLNSNHLDALRLDASDKRVYAIQCEAEPKTQEEHKAFWDHWYSKGRTYARTQLNHYLMSIDLTDFDPFGDPPQTEARALLVENTSFVGRVVDAILDAWGEHAGAKGLSRGQLMTALAAVHDETVGGGFMKPDTGWPENWRTQGNQHFNSRVLRVEKYRQTRDRDGRQWIDSGRQRPQDAGKGNINQWGKKQEICMLRTPPPGDLSDYSQDVDWVKIAEVGVDTVREILGFSDDVVKSAKERAAAEMRRKVREDEKRAKQRRKGK